MPVHQWHCQVAIEGLFHTIELLCHQKREEELQQYHGLRHTQNVVCIPPNNFESNSIPIPRGENRASLMEAGLVAKLSFDSTWNETQICAEIYGLFKQYFENENEPERMFSFEYLR